MDVHDAFGAENCPGSTNCPACAAVARREVNEQVLAPRFGAFQHVPIELSCLLRERSLWAGYRHRLARESVVEQAGKPVDDVTFWH